MSNDLLIEADEVLPLPMDCVEAGRSRRDDRVDLDEVGRALQRSGTISLELDGQLIGTTTLLRLPPSVLLGPG